MAPSSELIEIFSAIQGEGPIVGRRQLFVRFGRCDVKCDYCDTPLCHVTLPRCRVEQTPGRRDFEWHENPVDLETLVDWIDRLARPGLHHSISLTGGEPLLHAEVLSCLGPELRRRGLTAYLETNGHLVDELRVAMDAIDIVGMDIKIPSTTGFETRFDENRDFLRLAVDAGKDVFVKVVVGESTTDDEVVGAALVVADVSREIPFVLQPVTPFKGHGVPPSPDRLLELHERALEHTAQARVIPQTHKMIGQL